MVRLFGFFAGVLVLMVATAPAGADDPKVKPKDTELRIGLLQHMFKDVPQTLINTAAKPFESMIKSKTGRKGTLEMLAGYKELADAIRNGKIDLAVFHGFEYAWVKDTPDLAPLVVAVPSCGSVQACLVVNKTSVAKTAACLKGKSVLVPKGTKAHCTMYLDHLRCNLPAGDCCPDKQTDLGVEQALFELGGGKADAAVVDISALKALENNYPGCFRQLRVLKKSEPLPAAVVVYRVGAIDAKGLKQLKDGLVNSVKTPEGYAFTVFWQLQGFAEVSDKYNDQVKKCLEAFPIPAAAMTPTPEGPLPK